MKKTNKLFSTPTSVTIKLSALIKYLDCREGIEMSCAADFRRCSYINRIAAPSTPNPRFFGNALVLGSSIVIFGGVSVTQG
jgi:hypothetical protein